MNPDGVYTEESPISKPVASPWGPVRRSTQATNRGENDSSREARFTLHPSALTPRAGQSAPCVHGDAQATQRPAWPGERPGGRDASLVNEAEAPSESSAD